MKRRILLVSLLATIFIFGGRWVTRTEPSEVTRPSRVKETMGVVSEPPSIATLLQPRQPQDAAAPNGPIISIKPKIDSADLRTRAARYEPLINSAAIRHGVDARWLWIIAYLETRFRPELVSPKGARGMMQFIDETAERYNLVDPHDAAASIDAAARYVRDLQKRFGNRLDLVLASYNAGEGAVDAYLKGYALRLPNGRVINPQGLNSAASRPTRKPETTSRAGSISHAFSPYRTFRPYLLTHRQQEDRPRARAGRASSRPGMRPYVRNSRRRSRRLRRRMSR